MRTFTKFFQLVCCLVFYVFATASMPSDANQKVFSTEQLNAELANAKMVATPAATVAEKSENKSFFGKIASKISNKVTNIKNTYKAIRNIKTDSRVLRIGLIMLGIGILMVVLVYAIALSSTSATAAGVGALGILALLGYLAILGGVVVTIIGLVR